SRAPGTGGPGSTRLSRFSVAIVPSKSTPMISLRTNRFLFLSAQFPSSQHFPKETDGVFDRKTERFADLAAGTAHTEPVETEDPPVFACERAPAGLDARFDHEARHAPGRHLVLVLSILTQEKLAVGHRHHPDALPLGLQGPGGLESQ